MTFVPAFVPALRAPAGSVGGLNYLLRDEFLTARAAGAVHNTPAEPGPDTRVVVDTNVVLSIASGAAHIATGGVGNGNPGLWYGARARILGRTVVIRHTPTLGRVYIGWDIDQSGLGYDCLAMIHGAGNLGFLRGGSLLSGIGTIVAGVAYDVAIVLRSSGSFAFIKGGTFTQWTLVWAEAGGAITPLYPVIELDAIAASVSDSDFIRVPDALFIPAPVAYDTFTRANGAIGSSETTGPDSQAVIALTWTGPTWTISGNKAINTPTLGAELIVNGNFSAWTADNPDGWIVTAESAGTKEVTQRAPNTGHAGAGTGAANYWIDATSPQMSLSQNILVLGGWYQAMLTLSNFVIGNIKMILGNINQGSSISSVGAKAFSGWADAVAFVITRNGAPTDITIDDVSVKKIPTADVFCTLQGSTPDVIIDVAVTVDATAGSQHYAGLVLNLDSATSPLNYVVAQITPTGAYRVLKCVNGLFTSVTSGAITYVAGQVLRVIKYGTSYDIYYNSNKLGSTLTIADAAIISNSLHGLFSTVPGSSFDNFQLFARGTSNEYAALDAF